MASESRTVVLRVRVTPTGAASLDALAESLECSRSEVVRRALRSFVDSAGDRVASRGMVRPVGLPVHYSPVPAGPREARPAPKDGAR